MKFSNKTYDVLKWVTLVVLPAFATFYMTMANAWNLPYPTEIAGTIAAIDVLLAALLGISTNTYNRNTKSSALRAQATKDVSTSWILSDDLYDWMKWFAQALLPALAAFYMAVSKIWGLPYAESIVATLMAIDTFLGLLLDFNASQFMSMVLNKELVSLESLDVKMAVKK